MFIFFNFEDSLVVAMSGCEHIIFGYETSSTKGFTSILLVVICYRMFRNNSEVKSDVDVWGSTKS